MGCECARAAIYIALRLAIAFVLICCMGLGRMPVYRGTLSPQESAENCNHMTWVYGADQKILRFCEEIAPRETESLDIGGWRLEYTAE